MNMSQVGHEFQREAIAINGMVTFKPLGVLTKSDIAEKLRTAWANLRFYIPNIAAVADYRAVTYHVPISMAALEQWIDETFEIDYISHSAKDKALNVRPNRYACLYYIYQSCEILYHTSHWRQDGIGVAMLLGMIPEMMFRSDLRNLSEIPWGSETVHLATSLEEAANCPLELTASQKEYATEFAHKWSKSPDSVGIPVLCDTWVAPSGTSNVKITFSSDETQEIILASKRLGFSVSSTSHASLICANYGLAYPEDKGKPYDSNIQFSLRPYLNQKYSASTSAAMCLVMRYDVSFPADGDWNSYCNTFQTVYRRDIPSYDINTVGETAGILNVMMKNMMDGDNKVPSKASVSHGTLGMLDKFIKSRYGTENNGCCEQDVNICLEWPMPGMMGYVFTFSGKLNFNMCYNESYHSAKQAEDFLMAWKTNLEDKLGIERRDVHWKG